jgi:hypothetical protein
LADEEKSHAEIDDDFSFRVKAGAGFRLKLRSRDELRFKEDRNEGSTLDLSRRPRDKQQRLRPAQKRKCLRRAHHHLSDSSIARSYASSAPTNGARVMYVAIGASSAIASGPFVLTWWWIKA